MSIVLAAVDPSPVAPAVVATAQALAELAGATIEAVHVVAAPSEPPSPGEVGGVAVRTLRGPVEASLVAALAAEEVIAGVFGVRATSRGRRPAGHTALHVLERATKPVVVVPPDGVSTAPGPFRRLLLPLEGTADTSRPVLEGLSRLLTHEIELVVLHVFTPATLPRVLDRPARDLSMWSDEFIARFCPGAARVELRTGMVGSRVDEVCADAAVDLVVLSWSQDMSSGHAAVVRHVLAGSTVPVLLLPTGSTGATA